MHTALLYDGIPRRIVLAYKEDGRTGLASSLALALGAALERCPDEAEVLAVPSSSAAYRRRGFDPVFSIARAAGFRPARQLRMVSGTRQKSLGIEERVANRENSMHARRRLDGRRFVLIDDVLTTGATLDEAARAVEAAGGVVVGAAAIAFTPKRSMVLHGNSASNR